MDHYIGMNIDFVVGELENKGIPYKIINNNHNVIGDTTLVTNFELTKENTAIITVGEFIFNLKD
ncbi:MAG: hypothetical protein J6Q51_03055 [Clostridia bacterium]|nr:hypothetical protein [Clostridia bacterium]